MTIDWRDVSSFNTEGGRYAKPTVLQFFCLLSNGEFLEGKSGSGCKGSECFCAWHKGRLVNHVLSEGEFQNKCGPIAYGIWATG